MKSLLLLAEHLFLITYVVILVQMFKKRSIMLIFTLVIGPILIYVFVYYFLFPICVKYGLSWIELCLHFFVGLFVYCLIGGFVDGIVNKKKNEKGIEKRDGMN